MEDSTALTPVDPASSALASFGFVENEPFKPTNLQLVQPIMCGDAPGLVAGKFMDMQSNLQYDSIDIVPILMTNGRVLFPPGGDLGAKPICRSVDGIMPVISDDLIRQDCGLGCGSCQKSQWKRINGRSIRPECGEVIKFLMAEVGTQFIYRYNVKGVGLAPVKDVRETIRKMVLLAKSRGGFAPPYSLTFKLSSVKIKGAKGVYFIPKFTPTGQVLPGQLDLYQDIYTYFSTKRSTIAASDPVDVALSGEVSSGYDAA